jgi:hypothetical protein
MAGRPAASLTRLRCVLDDALTTAVPDGEKLPEGSKAGDIPHD